MSKTRYYHSNSMGLGTIIALTIIIGGLVQCIWTVQPTPLEIHFTL